MPSQNTSIVQDWRFTLTALTEYLKVQKRQGLPGFDVDPEKLKTFGPASPEDELRGLREEIGDCKLCRLSEKRQNLVFGEGSSEARLMFIGEGPGQKEDRTGRPFVGPAGELLERMIGAMGLNREDVYIANIVKCRPPGNRDPEPDEAMTCIPFLHRQVEIIAPEVICCLGRVATQNLLEIDTPISRIRGNYKTWRNNKVMPTFHPSYLLQNPEKKREAWADLQQIMETLGLQK